MRVRNNILILDTETIGSFGQPLVHDFGYCIVDKHFNCLKKQRHLIKNVRAIEWALQESDFYNTKRETYDHEIEQGLVDIKTWKATIDEFKRDLIVYGVGTIAAYNIAFDYKAIKTTEHILNNDSDYIEKLFTKKKPLCIWNLACDTLMQEREYKEWAKANKKISEKGNILTNAETCFQYINQDLHFKEDHTALSDVLIETEILKYIHEHYKINVDYGLMYGCWQKVQEISEN